MRVLRSMEPDGNVQVHIKVKNTGKRPSDEVVQMYVQHLGSAVTRPQIELKGFKRVRIEAGAEKDVTMQLKARDLAYWDTAAHAWRVEKEQVRILAGGSSDKLPVQTTVDVTDTKEFQAVMAAVFSCSEDRISPVPNCEGPGAPGT